MIGENQIFNGYVELRCPKCGYRKAFYVGNNPNNNTLKERYQEYERWCTHCDNYLFEDLSTTMSVSNWTESDMMYALAMANSYFANNTLHSDVYVLQKVLIDNDVDDEKKRIKIIQDYFSKRRKDY